MKKFALSAALAASLALSAASAANVPAYIERAVADPSRVPDDRKWDAVRKPAEVLAFANVKPGETIAEYLPGGGYYTHLLSHAVGSNGKIYALETTTWGKGNIEATKKAIRESGTNVSLDLSPLGTFHLSQKVDLFWTTNNYHDLHVPKYAKVNMAVFNKAVFNALKPGGTYFILDHAAAPGTGATLSPKLHRIDKQTVISEVTAAGFKLVGESDLLKNPNDDHSKVVFDPAIRFKTDQFMLMFGRP